MSLRGGAIPSQRPSSLPFRAALLGLVLLAAGISAPRTSLRVAAAVPSSPQLADTSGQRYYENAHPYLQEPLESLIKQIPELDGLQPAPDQRALPLILSSTGRSVEAYFDGIVDLVAHEQIKQEALNARGHFKAKQTLEDDYLILLHRDELPPRLEEYRTDSHGNRLDQAGLRGGFAVTSGFALKCIHFLPAYRSDSTFRYLGDQTIEARKTYVVAFAQVPFKATIVDTITVQGGTLPILMQGIAWIDQSSFQIIRLRTDLLAPRADIGLSRQSTEVTFTEVRLPDIPNPLWLPGTVRVDADFQGGVFRNEHQYSGYQRFRVSTRMVPQ